LGLGSDSNSPPEQLISAAVAIPSSELRLTTSGPAARQVAAEPSANLHTLGQKHCPSTVEPNLDSKPSTLTAGLTATSIVTSNQLLAAAT